VAATLQWLHRHKPAASRFLGDHPQWSTPQVQNPLPPGKGFGTSTADIAATAAATALACGATLAPENIAAIALQIEPTDGLMFPGIVRFDHLCGKVVEPLGQPPPLDIVVLDFGGCVDTVAFNARLRRAQLEPTAPDVQRAYELVRRGIANSDPALIGEGATLSALAHQSILPKPQLPRVLDFSRAVGALGVNVAHSGAVIGILLDGRHPRADIVLAEARAAFPALESSFATCLVSGGVRGIPTTVPDSPRNSLPRLP
jgi:L-threonine kinase